MVSPADTLDFSDAVGIAMENFSTNRFVLFFIAILDKYSQTVSLNSHFPCRQKLYSDLFFLNVHKT